MVVRILDYSYKRSQLCLKIKQLSYKSNLPFVVEMAKHCAMLIVHLVFHCQAWTGIRFAFHFRLLNTAGWRDRNGNLQIKCSLICRNGVYNGSIYLTWRWLVVTILQTQRSLPTSSSILASVLHVTSFETDMRPQTKWNPRNGTIFWYSFLCPCTWCGL